MIDHKLQTNGKMYVLSSDVFAVFHFWWFARPHVGELTQVVNPVDSMCPCMLCLVSLQGALEWRQLLLVLAPVLIFVPPPPKLSKKKINALTYSMVFILENYMYS